MTPSDLRALPARIGSFSRESVAAAFGLPSFLFTQRGPAGPIIFHQAGAIIPASYALRGTIFWPGDRNIVPGAPTTLPSSDHTAEPAAAHNDRALIDFLAEGEAVIEVREPGIAVRLYHHAGKAYFATNVSPDGSEPLTGAGIENARALGLDVGSQARRLCDQICPKAYRLAALGYVPVFVMLLPERETMPQADRPDLVLVDVIDPDYEFVDRLEKERIADDYGLHLVAQQGRLMQVSSPAEYFGRLRALELTAAQNDGPGFIVKAVTRQGQRLTVSAESPTSRSWAQRFEPFEIKAAHEAVRDDFGETILPPELLEELLLDYLGSRRRTVRWQAADWIARQ